MIKAIVCFSVLMVVCSAQRPYGLGLVPQAGLLVDDKPEPYQFGYNAADEYGTQWNRQEVADGSGAVRGSYGYRDASGIYRTVEYVADDVNGFRANVKSNEPGLISSAPAGVTYTVGNRK
ncbi:unnamed protein product [Medioppia subpectinata]|uniref:Cuticle protein n=1 Tax=Medioppia subpectinata TaxID=1979941 RepID=A0A7R9L5J0_9ACAR|nr:unnamed protein product [Medioppia subpectinata]CAG2114774.1 unnamed protein product [Medioppia subpectinata]